MAASSCALRTSIRRVSRRGRRKRGARACVGAGSENIAYNGGFRGPVALNLRDIGGDFVVWKSADTPAYQLAVVVDDAAQGITEVLRGDDLIPSTPRQIVLYRALGLTPPRFTHV